MSILTDLFTSTAQQATKGLLDGASGIIKDFVKTPDEVLKANEQLAQFKSEYDLKLLDAQSKVADAESQIEQKRLADVADARNMAIMTATSDKVPIFVKIQEPILALLIVGGFFGIIAFQMWWTVPIANQKTLDIMLGSLGTCFISVVAFFFGSSKSSKSKDDTINSLSKQ